MNLDNYVVGPEYDDHYDETTGRTIVSCRRCTFWTELLSYGSLAEATALATQHEHAVHR